MKYKDALCFGSGLFLCQKGSNMEKPKVKTLGEGILKDITRLIVETDEATPVPIVVITADDIEQADGYLVRLRPKYKNE